MISGEPTQSFEDINFSSTAFAEDSCGLQHAHGNVWTVKQRASYSDQDETDGMSEFGELHLNQGLDGIVRLDGKKRAALLSPSRLYCILFTAIAAIAVTTVVSVVLVVPNGDSFDDSHLVNTYEEKVDEIYQYFVTHGVSSESDLRQPGSPHYEALHWIAVHPGSQQVGSYPFVARYVLALVFFALGGPLFTFDSPICEWFQKDGQSGIECDEAGLPIALHFGKFPVREH